MRKLLILLCLSGCTLGYTKPESDAVYSQIGTAMNQQSAYLTLLIQKVYAKEIAACKAKDLGIDLKTEKCIKDPVQK